MGKYLHVAIPKYRHDKVVNFHGRSAGSQKGSKTGSSRKLNKILSQLNKLVKREESKDGRASPERRIPEAEEPDLVEAVVLAAAVSNQSEATSSDSASSSSDESDSIDTNGQDDNVSVYSLGLDE